MLPDNTEERSVAFAVQRLQDLADRMETYGFQFKVKDVASIDEVIEAIQELEIERGRVHDLLEAESIKSSILRHEMKTLHGEYKKEIQDAMENARQSIKDLVEELQRRIEDVGQSTDNLTAKLQTLEKHNVVLVPEKERLKEKHEEIILTLNQRMAEKAVNQIALNETRDRLHATNQRILELEDDIAQLKDDMIQERTDARVEMEKLRVAINETKQKTASQNAENMVAKRKLDTLQVHVQKSEEELDVYRKQIRKYELGRSKLEGQERALLSQQAKDSKFNEELRQRGIDTHSNHLQREKEYQIEIEDLTSRIKEMGGDYKAKIEQAERLKERRTELAQDAANAEEAALVAHQRSKDVSRVLEQAQETLVRKQEDVARMRNESDRMELDIVELNEEHKVFVVNYNRQIDEFKEQLTKEKKDRMEVQTSRDSTQKQLEEFKQTTQKYMAEVNKRVSHGKQQHATLTQEGTQLQVHIREADEAILNYKSRLESERLAFEQKQRELEDKVARLKEETTTFEKRKVAVKVALATKVPLFEAAEKRFTDVSLQYDVIKKDVAGKKSEKQSLEDQVKRARATIDRLSHPQERLRLQLSENQQQSLQQMRTQMEELRLVEHNIFVAESKLDTLLLENARFKNSIEILQNDNAELQVKQNFCESDTAKLGRYYRLLQELLHSHWMDDYNAGEASAARDRQTLDRFGQVLAMATKRQSTVTVITERMESELELLAQFLETVSSRRPRGTSESKRPTTADKATSISSLSVLEEAAMPLTAIEAVAAQPRSGRSTPLHENELAVISRRPVSGSSRLPSARSPLPPIGHSATA